MKKIIDRFLKWLPDELGISFTLILICGTIIGLGFHCYHVGDINDAQLGYLGSVVGGGITLLGVYLTIDHNNQINKKQREQHEKERKEELELMYQPILSAKITNYKETNKLCNEITLQFNHNGFDDHILNTAPYMIEFTNTGRGEIKDYSLRMESCSIVSSPFDNENELDLSDSYVLGDGSFNFFPINGSNYTTINIPNQNTLYLITDIIRISVTLEISITGFTQETKHKYILGFYITLPLNGKTEEIDMDSLTISYIGKEKIEKEIHSVG